MSPIADNIVVSTSGGSEVIAADDIAGVKSQRVKIQTGADGTATDVSTSNPIPVSDAGGSLTVDGTVVVNLRDGSGTAITSSVRGATNDRQALDVAFTSAIKDMSVTAGSGTRYFPNSSGVDTLNYGTYTLFCTAVGAGASDMSLEFSDDGSVWVNLPQENIGVNAVTSSTSLVLYSGISAGSRWTGPCYFRYMRIKTTTTTTGTYAMQVALTPAALPKNVIYSQGANSDGDTRGPSALVATQSLDMVYGQSGLWDRVRSANYASNTTGTGVPASGEMYFDGTNWQRVALATPMPVRSVSNTATLANVSGSASSVTLVASNTARKGLVLHNDSTATLYVKFGATASTTSYTYKVVADAHLELPTMTYTGIVDGIWASANGSARTTELT